jgi:uncharacterized Zn-binding protein involved in type VI secretion
MTELVAVRGDGNTHGGGNLIPQNAKTVFVEGRNVIEDSDPASADGLCPGSGHCNPVSTSGSNSVFVYGNPLHRNGDNRVCGATTTVTNQSSVYAGD